MCRFRKKIKKYFMCFPSVVFYLKKKCSEWQIFFRAFRVEVFLNASAKSSHSGGPLGRHQVLFSQNSMKFYQNWIGSFSAVSRNFWVFSSGSSRECLYFAVSQRKTPKFEKKREKNCNESHDFLMRLLIVKVNKLVWIITQRNWLVSKIALGDH